jgi:hypothetical protein
VCAASAIVWPLGSATRDPVHRRKVDVVLKSAGIGHARGRTLRSGRPIGRQSDQVGTAQRQATSRLGKRAVVTNEHPNSQLAGLENLERTIARRREPVHAQKRQMRLAVRSHQAGRPDEQCSVVEMLARSLERTDNDEHVKLRARRRQPGDRLPRHVFRMGAGFVGVFEAVAGDRGLGKDDQFGALGRRGAHLQLDRGEICLAVGKGGFHLYTGNPNGHGPRPR